MSGPRTPATPVTPSAQKQYQATPTGAWKHPKFDEITRRQYATTFDDRNVRIIVTNLSLLALSFVAFAIVSQIALLRALSVPLVNFAATLQPIPNYLIWVLRLLLLGNATQASLPLLRRYTPDEIADIPLTPSQRQALGLDPNVSTPMTPGSAFASPNYVTPPRYQKSTPRNSFGTPGDYQSPLTGSPRASMGKSTSNSPFSPSTGSPLFQKAVGGGSATKRMSFDSRNSPMSNSIFDSSSSNTPGTPTPGTGRASVGLNSKWLYEKRRDSPRSNMFL
ncbi:nuclear pore complex component-domain-containing protein [Dendryphion nanum]|uniref:Nuclear pore complex component-domain-containing protein n=1 Tax=Dendryphion nanum TaxID=256645 RepID=A0A9P9ECQ7_9PLEO|nr:nuclear pore complex component-domain-containing protein [Dendryphion nanum]